MTRRLEADNNPKKVLKPEKDQGYTNVLPAAGAKEAAAKAQGDAK